MPNITKANLVTPLGIKISVLPTHQSLHNIKCAWIQDDPAFTNFNFHANTDTEHVKLFVQLKSDTLISQE
jgi:hypothetical protein